VTNERFASLRFHANRVLVTIGIPKVAKATGFRLRLGGGVALADHRPKGTLKVLPPEYRIAMLQPDYANMREMLFGEPPKFDSILTLLKDWEREFNRG
jgi:hypothetical protein